MKKAVVLILAFCIVPIATGQITLRVCKSDGVTPFDFNDQVMVGDHLNIIVSSDCKDIWGGGLFIEGPNRAFGTLAGRDYDPNRLLFEPNRSDLFRLYGIKSYVKDWTGSHYPEAGELARVTAWKDSNIWGFDFYTTDDIDDSNFAAGDWFVIDYYADEVGECYVGFYDYGDCSVDNSAFWSVPQYLLSFSHSPTRDLNFDGVVDFYDLEIFASYWGATDCNDPNWCDGADISRNNYINFYDFGLFAEYWLWGALNSDPNDPDDPIEGCQGDPNVTYSIVDFNGSNEITMGVNESIKLYVIMVTTEENNVCMFDIEVDISDTNLGSIDNTPIDSNDPLPTAQILAGPNLESAYWGPGLRQEEGIELFGTTWDSQISDGNLASFVFTCKGEGDVTLELINWESYNTDNENVCPKLEGILIHQNDPN